ncbi:MAG: hypothetical protein O3A29_19035, partial [Planctomycetota bacterium]|nr:hypothetical protein [Planctomycetota bacterium]
MHRTFTVLVFCGGFALSCGCSNFIETRTINEFVAAIDSNNLDHARTVSSQDFEQKALRNAQALEDFKILKLPTGEVSVVKVEDKSDDRKRVVVEVGENKRKLLYELVRNPKTNKWVVDDIFVNQRQQGIKATKSVTEQMDLLLSVRDFLDTWGGGSREEILNTADAELAATLAELPPTFLVKLTENIVGDYKKNSKFKPEAQLNDNAAIVRLPRSTGDMVISFALKNGDWKVQDIAVESRANKEHIVSVSKHATVLNSVSRFLENYAAQQQETVAALCTPEFYKGSLIYGQWDEVPLPAMEDLVHDYTIEITEHHAFFVADVDQDVMKVNLHRQENDTLGAPTKFLIEEITIYERGADQDRLQQKRLSALFTSKAMMQLFAHSLAERDLNMLRQCSTYELNQKVWKRVEPDVVPYLSLDDVNPDPPRIMSTVFKGPVTEITAIQGDQALTYVLIDQNGRMLVDDIILPTTERPNSLKQNLEFIIGIREFALGIEQHQLDRVQRNASSDFNRVVWHQTERPPVCGEQIVPILLTPVQSIQLQNDKAIVRLGNPERSITVLMNTEAQHWVIDDMVLIDGPELRDQYTMKREMRLELARTTRRRGPITDPDSESAIVPVSYDQSARQPVT